MATIIYKSFLTYMLNKAIDFDADICYLALLGDTYTLDLDNDTLWSGISAHQITATGYTAGGRRIYGQEVTYANHTVNIYGYDVSWPNFTGSFRYAVAYHSGTGALLFCVDMGETKSVLADTVCIRLGKHDTLYAAAQLYNSVTSNYDIRILKMDANEMSVDDLTAETYLESSVLYCVRDVLVDDTYVYVLLKSSSTINKIVKFNKATMDYVGQYSFSSGSYFVGGCLSTNYIFTVTAIGEVRVISKATMGLYKTGNTLYSVSDVKSNGTYVYLTDNVSRTIKVLDYDLNTYGSTAVASYSFQAIEIDDSYIYASFVDFYNLSKYNISTLALVSTGNTDEISNPYCMREYGSYLYVVDDLDNLLQVSKSTLSINQTKYIGYFSLISNTRRVISENDVRVFYQSSGLSSAAFQTFTTIFSRAYLDGTSVYRYSVTACDPTPVYTDPVIGFTASDVINVSLDIPVSTVTAAAISDIVINGDMIIQVPAAASSLAAAHMPSIDAGLTHVYLSSYSSTISGSINEYVGSISSGSNQLTLTTSHDFAVNQGIAIKGASTNRDYNYALITKVTGVNGNVLTLQNSATASVSNQNVSHDDTAAINTVIASGNAHYHFDFDTLNVKALNLQSGGIYDGDNQCTLRLTTVWSSVQYVDHMINIQNETGVTFQNFIIDGGKTRGVIGDTEKGTRLLTINNSSNVTIRDNTFQNNYYLAIHMRNTLTNINVLYNYMTNTDTGIIAMPEVGETLTMEYCDFSYNNMTGGTSEGISMETGMRSNTGHAKYITISHNTVANKVANGIQYGSRTTDIDITYNDVSYCSAGIVSVDDQYEPLESFLETGNINIAYNDVHHNSWGQVRLEGYGINFNNNTVRNANEGLQIGLKVWAENITVDNNTFTSLSTSGGAAIMLYPLYTCEIKNNDYVTLGSTNTAIEVKNSAINFLNIHDENLGSAVVKNLGSVTTIANLNAIYGD